MTAVVVSILLLSAFTTATALATVSLYRLLEKSSSPASTLLSWPFEGLRPGQPIGEFLDAAWPRTGFYVFASPDSDAFSSSMSTSVVASAWRHDAVVALEEGGLAADWVTQLSSHGNVSVTTLDAAVFQKFGVTTVPVIAFVSGGRVVDAVSGLVSPSAIADFFRLVAAPSLSGLEEPRLELQ